MENMDAAEAALRKWYAEDRGRRVARGMREKAERGIMPGCAPLGYINAVIGGERVIVPDPGTAPLVRKAFELATTGRYSLRKLLSVMTSKGLVSRNGKPLGASALWTVLTNPVYAGRIRYNGELLPGRHEAIVDDDLLMKTAAVLEGKRSGSTIDS